MGIVDEGVLAFGADSLKHFTIIFISNQKENNDNGCLQECLKGQRVYRRSRVKKESKSRRQWRSTSDMSFQEVWVNTNAMGSRTTTFSALKVLHNPLAWMPPPLLRYGSQLKNVLINSGVASSSTSIDRFLIIILTVVPFYIPSCLQLAADTTVNIEAGRWRGGKGVNLPK